MLSKINPLAVTNFDRTQHGLEYFWFYAVICAGKQSEWASRTTVEVFDNKPPYARPLNWLSDGRRLRRVLESNSVGQYNRIGQCVKESADVDLGTVTVQELRDLHGVGPKTARFFVLHSQEDADCVPLDTHILQWLKLHNTRKVPKDTPSNKKEYHRLERRAVRLIREFFPDLSTAESDLLIWSVMSGRVESNDELAFPF